MTLVTDSVYVGKGLSEWMAKWKANGWRRREGQQWKEIKNEDLWRELDRLVAEHELRFEHVAGHSGHVENERCDKLAVAAYQQFLHAAVAAARRWRQGHPAAFPGVRSVSGVWLKGRRPDAQAIRLAPRLERKAG